MNLKHPYMRSYLIDTLDSFKNKKNQDKEWVKSNCSHAFWDNVILNCDPIGYFDSAIEQGEPDNFQEGYILYNYEETKVVMKVVRSYHKVIKKVGIYKSDETYIQSPLWHEVIENSKQAYDLLIKNNEKYGFSLEEIENNSSEQSSLEDESIV